MARWAGEGNDCMKLGAQNNPHKKHVIRSLLETLKHAADPSGTRPIKKPRDLLPLHLMYRRLGRGRPWKAEAAKRWCIGSMATPS